MTYHIELTQEAHGPHHSPKKQYHSYDYAMTLIKKEKNHYLLFKRLAFLKYKISICLDHTFMYIVLRVPYACNFVAFDSIM